MNIVKWMRKNNRQLMAFVVIFIMVSFVGGYALQQLLMQFASSRTGALWSYRGGQIKRAEFLQAQKELEILRALQMPIYLRYKQTIMGGPDIRANMLGHLLFPEAGSASMLSEQLLSAQMQGRLLLTHEQMDEIFRRDINMSPQFWIMLHAEAEQAGSVVSMSDATELLKGLVPRLTAGPEGQGGISAKDLVGLIMKRDRVPEDQIIGTFAKMLAVLNYAQMVTVREDLTVNQLRGQIARKGDSVAQVRPEQISAELVKFPIVNFTDSIDEPKDLELTQQLNGFKANEPGRASKENPYGFGYKLPPRVQLDYLLIRQEQVKETIEPPTPEEMELFYQQNQDNTQYSNIFKQRIPPDPNDPAAEEIQKTRPYAEVAGRVRDILVRQKTNRKADMIINEARSLCDAPFAGMDPAEVTGEQLSQAAVEYGVIAGQLKDKYKLQVYSGRTGWLSAEEIGQDSTLSRLSMQGQTRIPVRLSKMVFAVEPLKTTTLNRFEGLTPKMWANLGPLKDSFSEYTQMSALVRVVAARPAEEPADIAVSYSTQGIALDDPNQAMGRVFSVREQLVEDVKLVKAIPMARQRAEEFLKMIQEDDWDKAVTAYNEKYAKDDDNHKIALDKLRDRNRTTMLEIQKMKQMIREYPVAASYYEETLQTGQLLERLLPLIPDGQTEAQAALNRVLEFEPSRVVYAIKSVTRKPVTIQDYVKAKPLASYQIDAAISDTLSVVHFNPENVLKRMEFKVVDEEETSSSSEAGISGPADEPQEDKGV
ncbi:MAG: hypothetical protein JW828_11530 [Sedimentisphaerales bacterium]|nr:hypothetical protein [Sedimentisphaerales bacterium]